MVINKLKDFYKDKNVFITGHTGFKGSWLTLFLSQLGANLTGYALKPSTNPSLFEVLSLDKRIKSIIGDIRDFKNLKQAVDKAKPDIIFHLAAQPLVRRSYKEPLYTYEVNVMGTVNILECARLCTTLQSLVNVTSDKCYENKEWIYGYRENEAMGGFDPYSSSKGCSELVTSAYRKSFFETPSSQNDSPAIASARAGNVIGGGDWTEDRLIPDCIKALKDNKNIIIRSPNSIRPWQHVLEPVLGYMLLAYRLDTEKEKYSKAWNFGPNDNDIWNVEKVVNSVIGKWGKGKYLIEKSDTLHEAKLLKLDISMARHVLNWEPVYDVECSLSKTVEWYKFFYENKSGDILNFTLKQINDYLEKAKNAYTTSSISASSTKSPTIIMNKNVDDEDYTKW